MPRFAKSDMEKRAQAAKKKQEALENAIKTYHDRAAHGKVSVRSVAHDCKVDAKTLGHALAPGYQSIYQFNVSKQKLSLAQEKILVEWIIELAEWNIGLRPTEVLERAQDLYHMNKIDGNINPAWIRRFFARHQDLLSRHWARPLDRVCAISATPAIIENYFKTYKSIVGEHGEKIPPHCQFAYDESGILCGLNQPSWVVSSRNGVSPKVNVSGNRELITFIPIISGEGKLINSLIIFPGKTLMPAWVKENPGNFA